MLALRYLKLRFQRPASQGDQKLPLGGVTRDVWEHERRGRE